MSLHPAHAAIAGAMLLPSRHRASFIRTARMKAPRVSSRFCKYVSHQRRRETSRVAPRAYTESTSKRVRRGLRRIPTRAGVLAIFSAAAQARYIPSLAEPATTRSVMLEFKVAHVDVEYWRLQPLVKTWVKLPTTQL
jgi:hypothetical protein